MTPRRLSPVTLRARIETLTRRHRELDRRITAAQTHAGVDATEVKRLKQERLGLKDAIRVTQKILRGLAKRPSPTRWQQQFHSG